MVELRTEDVTVTLDPEHGGRLAGLAVQGLELLVTDGADPLHWGCFPMAPWAGRLDRGVLRWQGEHRFEPTMPPHAIHGLSWDRPWEVVESGPADARLRLDLGDRWPWRGYVLHDVAIGPTQVDLRLEVHTDDAPFPAALGWHPWFRRRLDRGEPARIHLRAGRQWELGDDGLPTGRLVEPRPGPWDDCFTEVDQPVGVTWSGALSVEVSSSAAHWVVYDKEEQGVCVEPQTAPPDGLNRDPDLVTPGVPLIATASVSWGPPGAGQA